jgi:tRNA threonylcarbamoyladenosine biosynthesis protein TsaB
MKRYCAIDSTTQACSVAVVSEQGCVERYQEDSPRAHGRLLLAMVDELLQETALSLCDLDGLVVTQGPGSFTGVRMGIGVAQGLAVVDALPVLPVSSLATLAWMAKPKQQGQVLHVACAIDARMGEMYYASYQLSADRCVAVDQDQLLAPQTLHLPEQPVDVFVGAGWAVYREALSPEVRAQLPEQTIIHYPRAAAMADYAQTFGGDASRWLEAAQLQPVYLRDQVAVKPKA